MKRVSLKGFGADVNLLIDRKWDGDIVDPETGLKYPTFRAYLDNARVPNTVEYTAVNNVLADWINKIDWERLR